MRVTNERDRAARLSLFSAVEFCLWDALDDATNFQRNFSIGEVEVDGGVDLPHDRVPRAPQPLRVLRLLASRSPGSTPSATRSSARTAGGTTGRRRARALRRLDRPRLGAVRLAPRRARRWRRARRARSSSSLGYCENPRDAKFDPPGSQSTRRACRPVIERYLRAGAVDAAFARLRDHWSELLDGLQVATPNEHADRMVNIWNAYQCMVTFNLSRSASLFESGIGRGMGFRDSNQDLLGFVQMVPERARERHPRHRRDATRSGGAYHQYQPLTKRGNDAVGSGFNDDPLWLILAVAAYLKETGDAAILDEPVPFDNAPGQRGAAVRAPASARCTTRSTGSARTACR